MPRTGIEPVRSLPIAGFYVLCVCQFRHPGLYKRTTGFEPATPTLARWCSTTELRSHCFLYIKKCRLHDLNTRPSDYKSDALPTELSRLTFLMREKGLEPPRRKAPDPKSGASANSAKPAKYDPYWARTSDPLIKSQLLYQLS